MTLGKASLEYANNGEVALVRLGTAEEKVITLTPERMQSLNDIFDLLKSKSIKGLVLLGPRQDMFTAGADINLINQVSDPKQGQELSKQGQDLFNKLENLPFTTVAAISGPCVGGGCEMVLACKYRIVSNHKSSLIGLPEVQLGILPGFGGTQRLPRLIGLPKALDIILQGKTLKFNKAFAAGLVDRIVSPEELEKFAIDVAAQKTKLISHKIKAVDRFLTFNSLGRYVVKRKVSQSVAKTTKGFYPAPPAALATAIYGLQNGMLQGLELEAQELGRLIVSSECKSLVKIFFLRESAKNLGKSAKDAAEKLSTVVIGAGIMGAGIAGSLARSGLNVILKDSNEAGLQKGSDYIRDSLHKSRSLSETEKSFALNRIELTTKDSPNLSNSNFVIEAIFEEIETKKRILGEISKKVSSDAIIATNTSSLSVTEIAQAIDNPKRVIGMHFFNPVDKMPLVEIIRGKETSDKAIAIVAALTSKLKKFPIVVNDVPGFLVNRILSPYLNEAGYLLADGYSIKDIDKAALKFGMPMGPVRLLDEVGLDVASHVADTMFSAYGERMKSLMFTKTLVEKGRKGRKNSLGFYDFKDKTATPCSEIRSILGLKNSEISNANLSEIQDRLILSLVNEAVRCLDESVAGQPSKEAADQIDLGTVMGIGFPPFRGGIMHYAQSLGVKNIYEKLCSLEAKHGVRFKPAAGLKTRAEKNQNFY